MKITNRSGNLVLKYELIKITDNMVLFIYKKRVKKSPSYPIPNMHTTYSIVYIKSKQSGQTWCNDIGAALKTSDIYQWTNTEERYIKIYKNLLTKNINMLFYFAKRERRRRLCNG